MPISLFVSLSESMSAAAGIATGRPSRRYVPCLHSHRSRPAESLRPRVIHHDVRHDVPGEIGAVLEPDSEPRGFCASRLYENDDVQPARRCARLVAPELDMTLPLYEFSNRKWRVPAGESQHLGYQVEVDRGEERGLFRFTRGVLIKRFGRRPDSRRG